MRATVIPSVLLALAVLVGQGPPPRTPAKDSAPNVVADPRKPNARPVIFYGGKIVLNDGKGTITEALLERGGKVLAVGRLADIERNPDAQNALRVDLLGSTAVPGLQDAHGHLVSYGNSLVDVDLRGCASFAEVVERVAARANVEKEGTWIRGRGWDQNLWQDKSFPNHAALSEKTPKNPVLLTRVDGHAAIANRLALAAAKLDRPFEGEPKLTGGRLLVADGRATGVLVDRGMDLVEKCIPAPSRATIETRILAAQEKLLAFGLTCIHDMGTSRDELEVLKDLRARGRLRLRIVSYFAGTDELTDAMVADLPLLPDAGDLLACPGVKLIADGALGSRGAALLAGGRVPPAHRPVADRMTTVIDRMTTDR